TALVQRLVQAKLHTQVGDERLLGGQHRAEQPYRQGPGGRVGGLVRLRPVHSSATISPRADSTATTWSWTAPTVVITRAVGSSIGGRSNSSSRVKASSTRDSEW